MKLRKRAILVFAATLPLLQSTPAGAQCSGPYLLDVRRVVEFEGEKTERFRTGNKAAFKEILDARTKSGQRSKAADQQLDALLARRISEVHAGMPKQNAAIETFRKDWSAAAAKNDCATVQRAAETWLSQARARIAEYDRYFSLLEDLKAGRDGKAQSK
jgi:hypothetical protein